MLYCYNFRNDGKWSIFSIKRDIYDPEIPGRICKELTVTFGVGTGKLLIFEEYFSHPVIYEEFDADVIVNTFSV